MAGNSKKLVARNFILIAVFFITALIFVSFILTLYKSRNTLSDQVFLSEADMQDINTPSPSPETTPSPTKEPSPTPRLAFIPDPNELLPLPSLDEVEIQEGTLSNQLSGKELTASWQIVENADYYVLCAMNQENKIYHKEILWPDISQWIIPEAENGNIYLFSYEDMGQDSAEDDNLLYVYSAEITIKEEVKATPKPTTKQPTDTKTEQAVQNKYLLIVDKSDYTFSAYTYDENGKYTVHVKSFPTAIGRSSRMTPNGTFEISSKGAWKDWGSGSFSPFYTRYTSGLYIHGSLYSSKANDKMIQSYYEEIGTMATSGCLRTTFEASKWVYYNCPAGTTVIITQSSDKVTKVTKPAIDAVYPNWDPTDPDKPSANPPAMQTNITLRLEQGESASLSGMLSFTDEFYSDSSLVYNIVTSPKSGTLSKETFTQLELNEGSITYTHDGSAEDSDSFQFTVSNSTTSTKTMAFIIKINITDGNPATPEPADATPEPADTTPEPEPSTPEPVDEPPVMVVNEWITIDLNESRILKDSLLASDDLSDDDQIVYTITTMPEHGSLPSSFTQTELTSGNVVYVHDGSQSTSDSFIFTVSDGTNSLSSQMFSITINITDPISEPSS